MWIFNFKSRRNAFLLLSVVYCGCGDRGLTIETIGNHSYPVGGYDYNYPLSYREKVDRPPCLDSIQYYTIANYEHIAPDSLYKILNAYINTKYLYEKYAENLEHYNRDCYFNVFFYEKSLFVNYRKYIFDAIRDDMAHIDEYRHKIVALIYLYRDNNENDKKNDNEITAITTILYDVSYNKMPWRKDKPLSKRWIKEDTVLMQPKRARRK